MMGTKTILKLVMVVIAGVFLVVSYIEMKAGLTIDSKLTMICCLLAYIAQQNEK